MRWLQPRFIPAERAGREASSDGLGRVSNVVDGEELAVMKESDIFGEIEAK